MARALVPHAEGIDTPRVALKRTNRPLLKWGGLLSVLGIYSLGTLPFLRLPPLEDDKFWWIPKAIKVAESGPSLVTSGALPKLVLEGATGSIPSQWLAGLPDYGHPPLFFHYLGAVFSVASPSPLTVHLALLPLALLALLGTAQLTERLAPGWGVIGAALLGASPLFFAQGLRADLDLPLLAIIPFALNALIQGHWKLFALLATLATWTKEPGVLLGAPAAIAFILEPSTRRTFRNRVNIRNNLSTYLRHLSTPLAAALSPLLALGAWALVHYLATGWALASPERLPDGGLGFLWDLSVASRFLLFEQGRWCLLGLALFPWIIRGRHGGADVSHGDDLRHRGQVICWVFVGVVLLFFSTVGFFGASAGRLGGATHLRYFLPALPPLIACGVGGANSLYLKRGTWRPPLLLALSLGLSLWDMAGPPTLGPERNLFGAHVAQARQAIAPTVRGAVAQGQRVWIGQSEVPDFQFPGVWYVEEGIDNLKIYGPGTQADALEVGDWVVVSAHGEPPGLLRQRLGEGEVIVDSTQGRAWVKIIKVGEVLP